jgi:hypothetical protein
VSGQGDIAGAAAIERKWAEVGRATRAALVLMDYPEFPPCMPDEADPCGAPAQLHALSYLAALRAVVDHQLDHCGADPAVVITIYSDVRAKLETDPGCQGVHR